MAQDGVIAVNSAVDDQPEKVASLGKAESQKEAKDGHGAEPKKEFVPSEGLTTAGKLYGFVYIRLS